MTEGPWLDRIGPAGLPGPEGLPAHAEVAIVGGGLAGVATALFLAEAGVRPVLLEARGQLGAAASGRVPGLVFEGLGEHAFRLVSAMGEDAAAAIFRFSREGRALLADRVPTTAPGSLFAAIDDREPPMLRQSEEALRRIGSRVEWWAPEQVDATLGGAGFGPALFLPDDRLVDPAEAVRVLARAAAAQGATLRVGCRVTGMRDVPEGVRLDVGEHGLVADAVVLAAGPWLPEVDPFFADKLIPVREQALTLDGVQRPAAVGVRAQQGYATFRWTPAGELVAAGCRWASPHLEVGERDDGAVVDRIQERIEAMTRRLFPQLASAAVTRRWSWIETHTCDGLPIVGPVPGDARRVVCTGFQQNPVGLALRAARAVSDGLLTGRADVPAFFTPSRFF